VTDSRLTIDLDALAANHALLRELGGAEVAPVVKADGYGLGAGPVAKRLHAEGARTFFVARAGEGEALRRALGPSAAAAIYVLDGVDAAIASRLVEADLAPVLNSPAQVEAWAAHGAGRPSALHVDTGMNRLGLTLDQAADLAREPPPGLRVTHVMSHLACADEPDHPMNARQLAAFREARALFPGVEASLANSAGVFLGPDYGFDLTRPGISLYGGGPRGRPEPRLRTVATLEAPILQVREVRAGDTVGYGATFTAEGPMQVAILGAGYADGLLRAASPGAFAALHGRRVPLIGRVSMDLIAIDVTEVPAREGDPVQLLGPEVPTDELAAAAGTLAYELLVRLAPRAERRYIGEV
jgi:alanine racemase